VKKVVVHKHVHNGVHKVVHVKKVKKVVSHGYGVPAYMYPAYSYPSYGHAGSYGSVSAVGSFGSFSFSVGAPVVYPAAPAYVYDQVWIAPVTRTVLVGSDAFGNPIYQTVVVTPGAYRTARFMLLDDGSRDFVDYLP
jgi:hypothetical protein